jgi:hypothetical protein
MLDVISEKEVLPKGPEDEIIPTKIAQIDTHIKFLKDQHEALVRQIVEAECDRNLLISRAKELHITTDANYKIVEIPIYPKKAVDVEALKRLAPDKHALIVANLTSKAQDKIKLQLEKISVFIAQADVKAVISDKVLLAQIIPEPKAPSGYEVSVVRR